MTLGQSIFGDCLGSELDKERRLRSRLELIGVCRGRRRVRRRRSTRLGETREVWSLVPASKHAVTDCSDSSRDLGVRLVPDVGRGAGGLLELSFTWNIAVLGGYRAIRLSLERRERGRRWPRDEWARAGRKRRGDQPRR